MPASETNVEKLLLYVSSLREVSKYREMHSVTGASKGGVPDSWDGIGSLMWKICGEPSRIGARRSRNGP